MRVNVVQILRLDLIRVTYLCSSASQSFQDTAPYFVEGPLWCPAHLQDELKFCFLCEVFSDFSGSQ